MRSEGNWGARRRLPPMRFIQLDGASITTIGALLVLQTLPAIDRDAAVCRHVFARRRPREALAVRDSSFPVFDVMQSNKIPVVII